MLKTLELAPLYENENWRKVETLLGAANEIVLYLLNSADLLEHGGAVGGSWSTDKGQRFLSVCRASDSFESLMEAGYSCSECPDWNSGLGGRVEVGEGGAHVSRVGGLAQAVSEDQSGL